MNLALFDLDHTLIPFDSGMAWTQHLVRAGVLDAQAESRYLDFCHQYVAGTLDIHAMHHASMAPLAAFTAAQIRGWQADFAREIGPRIPPAMRALVADHQARGDLCAIVTATTRLVAEPFAQAFGIEHLLATEACMVNGVPTGAIDGLPCFREHKRTRVQQWLARCGDPARSLADFGQTWFYSDSYSDLPLLRAVSHPVVVSPDPRLRAHAAQCSWPVLEPR